MQGRILENRRVSQPDVTLYQLACGQLPFVGDSMAQLTYKIGKETHADIRTLNSQLPSGPAAVINRAMDENREQRYQRGDDMARDLGACLQPAPAKRHDIDIQS